MKTAWFLTHRIREAMRDGAFDPMGGGSTVEIDETYIGRKDGIESARLGDQELGHDPGRARR